ncbi:MAG: tRNA uridine-5-carboxymethylaminomethyl(34) synthesis GTPase MnmE [Verrucomicrobiota bacterium]|jgi:tRNA modification GTPase|nr:tRNA uridine-5-carboxymethylaminomethyl(34) synthesis GTPase MnmE [Verrucomicrobiota bacterium]
MIDDTIAAIATPLGEGGLAVIRLSGEQALAIAEKCFNPIGNSSAKPTAAGTHTLHYGKIIHEEREIDEVLLSVLRAPRTFTKEDTVEITCHGGLLASQSVLKAVLAAGARSADSGEFTRRAFLNGRIDLAQAEAVVDVIHARTDLALIAANEQLAGKLSQHINQLRDDLMQTLAHIEAHLDFPDEDIAPESMTQLLVRLDGVLAFIDELLATANEGQILRRGIRAAIVGRPNVGKSSLLNQLLGHERAIVTATAGTTRDTIEETANVRGIPVVFIDTAGLREAADAIEAEGIQRSYKSAATADLILHVLDSSEELTNEDQKYIDEFDGEKCILIANKIDQPLQLDLSGYEYIETCALNGGGIETLKEAIRTTVWNGEIRADMLPAMINSRHQDALRRAHTALEQSLAAGRAAANLELVALDLRIAVNAVGEVVGKTSTEDLLDSIFSQFCIGK